MEISNLSDAESKTLVIRMLKEFSEDLNSIKKIQKPEGRISSLWDNFKRFSIRIIRVPEGQEKEQEIGNLFEKNNERKLP